MAQCLNCYGMVEIDRDDITLLCRGIETGVCTSPNISAGDIERLQWERDDASSLPEYREEDADPHPPYY